MPKPAKPASQGTRNIAPPAASHDGPTLGNLLRPWLLAGCATMFAMRVLLPGEAVAWRGDGLPIVMGWILLVLATALLALAEPVVRPRFRAIDAGVASLVAWQALAALIATKREAPRPSINALWEILGLAACYLLFRQLLRTPREARTILVVWLALACAQAAFGVKQFFVDLPATRAAYHADPERALREAGQWSPAGSAQRALFEQRLESKEPLGTYALTNSLAGLLAPAAVALLAMGIELMRRPVRSNAAIACVGVLWLLVVACLVLTKSRSGYLGAGVGALFFLGSLRSKPGRGLLAGLAGITAILFCLVAMGIATGGLDWQVVSEAPKSLGYRWQYWQATLALITNHAFFGCGPGNFPDHYTRYKLPLASEEIAEPHNALLEAAATAGLPAAVLAALVTVLVAIRLGGQVAPSGRPTEHAPTRASEPNGISIPIALGGVLGLIAAWLFAPLSQVFFSGEMLLIALFVVCLSFAALHRTSNAERLSRPALLFAALVALCVNLLAAGGWSFPSVASPLWLLVALSADDPEEAHCAAPLSMWQRLLAATLTLVTVVAAFLTGYRPVLHAGASMREAEALAMKNPVAARRALEEACRADPWDSAPWRALAALEFSRFTGEPTTVAWQAVDRALVEARARRPHGSALWLETGDYTLEAFHRTHDRRRLDEAARAYRRAVELYPNHALRRASLAVAEHLLGNEKSAQAEIERALQLDRDTPHADKKLPAEVRAQLERLRTPALPTSSAPAETRRATSGADATSTAALRGGV